MFKKGVFQLSQIYGNFHFINFAFGSTDCSIKQVSRGKRQRNAMKKVVQMSQSLTTPEHMPIRLSIIEADL